MKRLAILGASGHGKVVADTAELCGWEEVLFFDDAFPQKRSIGAWKVVGNTESLLKQLSGFDGVIVGIGSNRTRQLKFDVLIKAGAQFARIIHPKATVSRYATIGVGSVVFANVAVNAGAVVGNNCILNTDCTVDHDCVLSKSVHISPGAHLSGEVIVGELSWVGVGACVTQCIEIADNAIVGAGATVIRNVAESKTVVGTPAKGI